MSEPFLGEIRMFGGNFAPRGWALCNGQLLPISQNSALFSLFGTIYGGDGRTTFALPDLRGRFPMHFGSGPGLSPRPQGQRSGNESTTLNVGNLPAHTHGVAPPVTNDRQTTNRPEGAVPARGGNYSTAGSTGVGDDFSTGSTGTGNPFSNLPPYTVINFIVALVGLYPSRS